MVFIRDTSVFKLQLRFMNIAENFESKPRYYVRRISFMITILEGEYGAGDVVKLLSAEDRKVLSWHATTENLQDDVKVRRDLTSLSESLCPYKNITLSLSGKVTDQDTYQQRIEPHPLSAYRHVSFRSAMLTEHSAPDGQVQLLFSEDGLPLDRSCLRWRSHDYVKLVLSEAGSSYRVFWLVQYDIVDKLDPISDGHDAVTGRGITNRRSCFDHPALDCRGESTGKDHGFHGIRRDEKRKSPWIAEVRPKGSRGRKKIWLGSFKSAERAARAVDAGYYYYNLQLKFNFLDSPSHLQKIPGDLSDPEMDEFVKKEAHRLAEIPPLAWISENQSNNTSWTEGFTSSQPRDICYGNNYSSDSMQLSPNANFVQGLPRLDDFTPPLMDSGSDLETNLPSTSYCNNLLRETLPETLGSSPDENLWQSPSNGSFPSIPAGILYPELEQADLCDPSLPPVFNVFGSEFTSGYVDMSNDIAGQSPTVIACRGISDANDSRFHEETETASHGYDSSLLVALSMQAESNGDYARDSCLFDWLLK